MKLSIEYTRDLKNMIVQLQNDRKELDLDIEKNFTLYNERVKNKMKRIKIIKEAINKLI